MNANPHASESVGTLGEEAAKLVHALTAAAEQRAGSRERANEPPDCAFCPLCQLIGVVRETSPETVESLGASLSALTSAVRSVVRAHTGEHPQPGEQEPRRDDGVHRIDLDDAWGDD